MRKRIFPATNATRRSSSPAARGCSQTVHFTYGFQAQALYERNGYELVGRVQDFPSGTDALWYRKRLKDPYTLVGLLQYISPSLQLLCGVFVLDESFSRDQLLGFGCIWLALALYAADGWRRSR